MAKFSGILAVVSGYKEEIIDNEPSGIFKPNIVKIRITGDLLYSKQNNKDSGRINDEITFNNTFSIIASPKIMTMLSECRGQKTGLYIQYNGLKLKVDSMDIKPPRIEFVTGGIWNYE